MAAGLSKTTMRKVTIAVLVLVVGVLAVYLGSPYWTLYQIRSAAAAGEGDRVAAYVDFPAVRSSVKSQFAAAMTKRMESKGKDNAFASVGHAIAFRMMDGLVDAMVSPEAVATMIRSGKAPRPVLDGKAAPFSASSGERPEPKVSRGYEGLDTFRAALVDPATNEETLVAVLSRQGAFTWKLTAVRIPGL